MLPPAMPALTVRPGDARSHRPVRRRQERGGASASCGFGQAKGQQSAADTTCLDELPQQPPLPEAGCATHPTCVPGAKHPFLLRMCGGKLAAAQAPPVVSSGPSSAEERGPGIREEPKLRCRCDRATWPLRKVRRWSGADARARLGAGHPREGGGGADIQGLSEKVDAATSNMSAISQRSGGSGSRIRRNFGCARTQDRRREVSCECV